MRRANKSSHRKAFLEKHVLKICSKFKGEHPCRSVISYFLFLEITLRHGCSPVNLQHIFKTPFTNNTSGGLLQSKDIVGKIKLSCYTLLQVSCNSNFQAYTMLIYLKRQIKLTFSTII